MVHTLGIRNSGVTTWNFRFMVGFFILGMSLLSHPALAFQDEKGAIENISASKGSSVQAATCTDGQAGIYECNNVDLISMLSLEELGAAPGITLNDAWGWTDAETAKQYALVGREDGTAFVDITDPYSPVYVGEVRRTGTAQDNVWRDVKVD